MTGWPARYETVWEPCWRGAGRSRASRCERGAIKPEMSWIRDAAVEAGDRIMSAGAQIVEQQDRFAALLASVDDGVGTAQSKLSELASVIVKVEREAANLSAETGPALIASLVQVKEAAAHAADRAREAIENIIPSSAGKLSEETRVALERVVRESVEERLREVEIVAARAVDLSARRVRPPDPANADPRPNALRPWNSMSKRPARISAKRTARRSLDACRC